MEFQPLGARQITAKFDGGTITSDAGGLLLRDVDQRAGIIERFARCFDDYRIAHKLEHTAQELLRQRIFGIALGYEDLNDHEQLRHDPLHGHQSGRFFHEYYGSYRYLPLYIFCGEHLLCAKLRPSDIDAAAGSVKIVSRIVSQIRQAWPSVRIVLRGDSGFCRENLMFWCEQNGVDFLFGLARNKRLVKIIGKELHEAKLAFEQTGKPARAFADFTYKTKKSWCRERRVVGKAEHLAKGSNPRFVVTSLDQSRLESQRLYEQQYCARGEMENRIKEQQLYLFADRTSCHSMRGNQLRLWFSSESRFQRAHRS